MSFLKKFGQRIIDNKIAKGFPIGDFDYDLKKLREETDELESALKKDKGVEEELADNIIMLMGIGEQYNPLINWEKILNEKMSICERRKIIKLGEKKFDKEEG